MTAPIGYRPCSCQRTYKDAIYRHINVVFKEGAAPPKFIFDQFTFCDSQCEKCGGEGWIAEESGTKREAELLLSEFRRKWKTA